METRTNNTANTTKQTIQRANQTGKNPRLPDICSSLSIKYTLLRLQMNKIEIVNYITIPSPIMLHRDRFQFNFTALRCRKTYTGHLFLQRNDILLGRLAINGCLNAIHTSGTQQRDNTVQRISSISSENRQSIVCNCVVGSGLSLCCATISLSVDGMQHSSDSI